MHTAPWSPGKHLICDEISLLFIPLSTECSELILLNHPFVGVHLSNFLNHASKFGSSTCSIRTLIVVITTFYLLSHVIYDWAGKSMAKSSAFLSPGTPENSFPHSFHGIPRVDFSEPLQPREQPRLLAPCPVLGQAFGVSIVGVPQ